MPSLGFSGKSGSQPYAIKVHNTTIIAFLAVEKTQIVVDKTFRRVSLFPRSLTQKVWQHVGSSGDVSNQFTFLRAYYKNKKQGKN